MPGEIKDPRRGNGKTCLELSDSLTLEKEYSKLNHSYVNPRHGCLELDVISQILLIFLLVFTGQLYGVSRSHSSSQPVLNIMAKPTIMFLYVSFLSPIK